MHTLSARARVLIMMMRWYALQTNRKSPHFLEPRHMYYSIKYALRKGGRQMVRSICSQPNGLARIGTFYLDVLHLTAQQPKRTRGNRPHTCSDEMPPISCELCAHVKCVLFHCGLVSVLRIISVYVVCLCIIGFCTPLCANGLFNLVSFQNYSVENDCVCFSCDSQPKAISNKWYLYKMTQTGNQLV